ncbi:MAG: bifunctional 3-demethylubiquinone-9 3-methyltransferase/ 2-octaprenyl-6-hydroxy phenol methylase [candidate division BRC1 bacterium ADurb.BinA364]|nr:MAG: bifunctional 3-demethylubiquinone-9 3-methyltransferase/ 2-octaprenyl-6-hydroxy phenol methylase [candidate division BRC1 bacterium ADurb.BinA364]
MRFRPSYMNEEPPGEPCADCSEWLGECPGCGADAESLAFLQWGRSLYRPLWFRYCRCERCGLVLVNPRRPARIAETTLRDQAKDPGIYIRRWDFDRIELARNIVRPVLRLLRPATRGERPPRWLDIGCATGNLLEVARAAGFEAHGIELNAAYARWIAEHRPHIRLFSGRLEEMPAGEPFDVVSADNVLEHIHEPRLFLRAIRERLAPAGLAAIRSPNFHSLPRLARSAFGIGGSGVSIDPDAHPCNYTRHSLLALLARERFHLQRAVERFMVSYPLKYGMARRFGGRGGWPARAARRLYPLCFAFDWLAPFGGVDLAVFARR